MLANCNSITMFNGSNFNTWKEEIHIVLACMDVDVALRTEHAPASPTANSSLEDIKNYREWERSNKISLMIMKVSVPEGLRSNLSKEANEHAKQFLIELEQCCARNEKTETTMLLNKLLSSRYKGHGTIREYILEMCSMASKLRSMKLDVPKDMLIHLVLNSLPVQFSQFKMCYNIIKERWSLNELILHCVQEEDRLIQEGTHLAFSHSGKGKKRKAEKNTAIDLYNVKKRNKSSVSSA